MVILYYIMGLLLSLLLLSFVPVRAVLQFKEEFTLELRYLFLRFPIVPGDGALPDEEEEEEDEDEEEESEEPSKKKKKGGAAAFKSALKKKGLAGFLEVLGEFIKLMKKAVTGTFRGLRLRRFDLYLALAGKEDPAAAAVRYGQISAGVYSACAGLLTLMPCRHTGVTVDLDFSGEENEISFTAELSIRPARVVKEALGLLFGGLRPFFKLLRLLKPAKGKSVNRKEVSYEPEQSQ